MQYGISLPAYAPLGSPEAIGQLAQGTERIGLASLDLRAVAAPHRPGHPRPRPSAEPGSKAIAADLETLAAIAARLAEAPAPAPACPA